LPVAVVKELSENIFMKFHLGAAIVGMLCIAVIDCHPQSANNFTVTAYYFGGPEKVDSLAVEKLTHIICLDPIPIAKIPSFPKLKKKRQNKFCNRPILRATLKPLMICFFF